MKLLTDASLAILQDHAGKHPKDFLSAIDPLEGLGGLENFDAPVEHVVVDLIQGSDVANDFANALSLFAALPGLTPSQAADPRLWTTLTLKDYWAYATSRYPITGAGLFGRLRANDQRTQAERQADAHQNWVKTHYFAGTPRIRLRDNAVSRLWWMAHYANGFPGHEASEILEVLIGGNQDVMRTLVSDRPWLSSSPNLATAVIEILLEDETFTKRPAEERRYGFRRFLRHVDLLAGRRVLGYLPVADLKAELTPEYFVKMKS
jgi:hypothetical protein